MDDKGRSAYWETDLRTSLGSHPRQPLALVLSDDSGAGLRALASRRSRAALPFAGKYRLIDFALSSCVNSGLDRVGVITQYQPRSLHAHLAHGQPWGLDRRAGGLTTLHPYQTGAGMGWYASSADAVYQNMDFVLRHRADDVFILQGDQVYSMDLNVLMAQHRKVQADLTLPVVAVDKENAARHHTVVVDDEGWVRTWLPPEAANPGPLAVMGVLLFSTDVLGDRLSEDAGQPDSTHDLVRDVLPRMVEAGDRVMASPYTGYWNTLQTVHDYWQAHMRLSSEESALNLQDAAWPIYTRAEVRPPMRVSARARVSHSLLSEGCIIEGTVEHSILGPGVYVAPGAVVRNAVIMRDTTVEERAVVENAILDANVIIGSLAQVGQVRRRVPRSGAAAPEPLIVVTGGVHVPAQEKVKAVGPILDGPPRAHHLDSSAAQETLHQDSRLNS